MKYFVTIVLLALHINSCAQLPEYYVDLVKGEITVQNKKQILKAHDFVYPADILVLKKTGAEVTLVNKEGDFFVLADRGTYRAADLSKRKRQTSTGITKKYFQLVWNELENPSNTLKSGVANMVNTWGGVSRGSCMQKLYPPDAYTAAGDTIRFSWSASAPGQGYRFTLMDEKTNPLFELLLQDTQIVLKHHLAFRAGIPIACRTDKRNCK